jgi:serine kinase of HPr protein (carbohydrate metabolism regulator)
LASPSIHASCVLVGPGAVLIRGPSGSGKSRLALLLLQAAESGVLKFARLVADDRTIVEVHHGRLLARPPQELAGLLEIRGTGIVRVPFEPLAVVDLVVDLAGESERMPDESQDMAGIGGIRLDHAVIPPGTDPKMAVLARLGVGMGDPYMRSPRPVRGK